MKQMVNHIISQFEAYYKSIVDVNPEHKENLEIKYDHSYRVAELCEVLATKLNWNKVEKSQAYVTGLLHDIGRFKQLIEYNTFNDSKSVDHAALSVEIVKELELFDEFEEEQANAIGKAIFSHNKRELPKNCNEDERQLASILRDADKLDILKVITDYYTNPRAVPNHTLTWELPKGNQVSPEVAKQVINHLLVRKEDVASQIDIKVMQLSWVYDLNFKPSFQLLMDKRYPEKIYGTMSKSDTVIQIYRTIKVFAQNKLMA